MHPPDTGLGTSSRENWTTADDADNLKHRVVEICPGHHPGGLPNDDGRDGLIAFRSEYPEKCASLCRMR